jgi:predicted GIY-YIG superfamily endonuclease
MLSQIFTCYLFICTGLQTYYMRLTPNNVEERLKEHVSTHTGFKAKVKD